MAAAIQPASALTLEEYLSTSYEPDCDFVDGHLEERNLGESSHGLLQVELASGFACTSRNGMFASSLSCVHVFKSSVSAVRILIRDDQAIHPRSRRQARAGRP